MFFCWHSGVRADNERKSRNKRAAEKYRKKKRTELEQQALDLQAATGANILLRQRLVLQDRLLQLYREQLSAQSDGLSPLTRVLEAELAEFVADEAAAADAEAAEAAEAAFDETEAEAASALGALSAGSPHSSVLSETDDSNL